MNKVTTQVGHAIVVLQRGWVAVGKTFLTESDCHIENAKIIRSWGTKKGLGELALNGPTKETVLDDSGTIRFHRLAVVLTMDTEAAKWN